MTKESSPQAGKLISAVYPISASPPTWGHADIMYRAAKQFEKLYWIAAVNPRKPGYFTPELKIKMMRAYVDYYRLKNVEIEYFSGTVVRLATEKKAAFIIRGLRNGNDFINEMDISIGNRGINKSMETICMFTKPHFACISSSLVRELSSLGERTDQYCLPEVSKMVAEVLPPQT